MMATHRIFPHSFGMLALFIAFAALGPTDSFAQANEDRWKISAEFSFTDQSGNKVLQLLTGGLSVSHLQRDDFRLDTSFKTRYGRSNGDLVAFSHTASLAFDFRPEADWSPFLFTDAERDEMKRLDVRLSSGAGIKRVFYRGGRSDEVSLSIAMLHSYEQIAPRRETEDLSPLPGSTSQAARWSMRSRLRYQIRDGVTLNHLTLYQPVANEMADYLLRSDTGVKVLLTEQLALSVEYQLKRDGRPPEGVGPNDRLLTTGLIIDF